MAHSKKLKQALDTLLTESDRGAVLIGAELIGLQLEKLLIAGAPKSASKKILKNAIAPSGVWGSLSMKTHAAYLAGFVPVSMFHAINVIRRIRNDAAHSSVDFRLRPHSTGMDEVMRNWDGLVETVEYWIRMRLIVPFMKLEDSQGPGDDQFEMPRFEKLDELLDFIGENPHLVAATGEPVDRIRLHYLVSFICEGIEHYATTKSKD